VRRRPAQRLPGAGPQREDWLFIGTHLLSLGSLLALRT
jgi:hypothetical protein